jgi:cation:H+ antiporter
MATGTTVASILIPIVAALPLWPAALLSFGAVFVVLTAASWYTSGLEALSDWRHYSPGLLGLLGALGANVPNYAASLTVSVEGQTTVAQGIIVGSNIYNLAIILAIVVFAVPAGRGLGLRPDERRDVMQVAWLVLAMAVTTLFIIVALVVPALLAAARSGILVVTLGLFAVLAVHAVRRDSRRSKDPAKLETPITARAASPTATASVSSLPWATVKILLALALTLGGVVLMVQAGQALSLDVHLPGSVSSLVFLAVATSLPNTVVAYQLARTRREVAAVEEILSSNGVNIALGSALPLLLWPSALHGQPLLFVDAALMVALQVVVLLSVRRGTISRALAGTLVLTYAGWVLLHFWI